jgi:hypothetical protein
VFKYGIMVGNMPYWEMCSTKLSVECNSPSRKCQVGLSFCYSSLSPGHSFHSLSYGRSIVSSEKSSHRLLDNVSSLNVCHPTFSLRAIRRHLCTMQGLQTSRQIDLQHYSTLHKCIPQLCSFYLHTNTRGLIHTPAK